VRLPKRIKPVELELGELATDAVVG